MKLLKTNLVLLSALLISSCCGTPEVKSYNEGINIIPSPQSLIQTSEERFTLSPKSSIMAQGEQATTVAEFFASKIKASTGYNINVSENDSDIELVIDSTVSPSQEGYTLSVTADKVKVVGASAAALFYGMQSFMQLLPAEIENPTKVTRIAWSAPAVEIADAPRFDYRGIMFDSGRHFIEVDFLKKQLDLLALFKINRMHWHLTEDQGWRVEIKKYPLLTEIGSVRHNPEGGTHSGFYTQDEIREVVAYAAERFITVIPEFELPGHELAAISAYPHLSCNNDKVTPRLTAGVEPIVMCPGKPTTFEFIEDVIAELAPLFPSEYFHIGGDECFKEMWEKCPLCQEFIRKNDLQAKDGHSAEERLQSYVVHYAEQVLKKHNKRLIGWDEILEGGLSQTATVMSWRGEKGGIAAAKMGRNVIMSPQTEGMYINFFQGDFRIEPVTISGNVPLSKTYSYNPVPEELRGTDQEHFILGAQANLWSEYMYTPELVEYQAYPRVMALAEVGWTQTSVKDIDDFYRRLNNAYVRLDAYDINYYIAQPEQLYGSTNYVAFTDSTTLEFSSTIPVKMVYTTDGSEPTASSQEYCEPLTFNHTTDLKIRSVLPSGKMSPTRNISIVKQELREAVQVANLENGLRVESTAGTHLNMEEFNAAEGPTSERIAKTLEDVVLRKGFHFRLPLEDQESNVAQGYINIPKDGVYHFWTDNNELWIAGQKVVDNDNEVKRHSRGGRSIALAKGLHPLKTVWLGHVIGGWPTNWCNGSITMRHEDDTEYRNVKPADIFYEL